MRGRDPGAPRAIHQRFIPDAVEEKLDCDRLQEVLDEVWREKPLTEEERAWANRILGA